jgi:hypothetical protein
MLLQLIGKESPMRRSSLRRDRVYRFFVALTALGALSWVAIGPVAAASGQPDPDAHRRHGGDSAPVGSSCDASAAFPPTSVTGTLPFRNWCFGVSHQRPFVLDDGQSGPRIHGFAYSEWGVPRNMDLMGGRIPGNYAPVAHDVFESTSPLVPADAEFRPSPRCSPDRPMIDDAVDLITGSPLLRQVDLELPFGGATFRLLRTYSEPSIFDRVATFGTGAETNGGQTFNLFDGASSHHAPPSQLWDWAGQGWMLGEAPLFLIDARYAYMNAPNDLVDRPRCIFMPDAHHSIPFFYVDPEPAGQINPGDIRYEAPPRFDASLEHSENGVVDQSSKYWELTSDTGADPFADDGAGILRGPSEWYVWMHNRSVKYTIKPVYDALPRVLRFDDSISPGLATSVHEIPASILDDGSDSEDQFWDYKARPFHGIPFYGLVTLIEDRHGNRIEIDYCEAERAADTEESQYEWIDPGVDCIPCAQNCAERGQIKTVRLRTGGAGGEVAWTLHYTYRQFAAPSFKLDTIRRDPAASHGGDFDASPSGGVSMRSQNALAAVLVYDGDAPDQSASPCFTYPYVDLSSRSDCEGALPDPGYDPYTEFGLPTDHVYRVDYHYLDPWDGAHVTAHLRQLRTFSCLSVKGLPHHAGVPTSTEIWEKLFSAMQLEYTRSPRLLQVTVTEPLSSRGHWTRRHTQSTGTRGIAVSTGRIASRSTWSLTPTLSIGCAPILLASAVT